MAYMYTTKSSSSQKRFTGDDTVTGEFDHRSSMTATPGKYIYIYIRQDTANGGKRICDIITGKYNFNKYSEIPESGVQNTVM